MNAESVNPLIVSQYVGPFEGFFGGSLAVIFFTIVLYMVLTIAGELIRQAWNFIDENKRGDNGDFGSPFIMAVARLRGLNQVKKYRDSSWWDYKNTEQGRSEETYEVFMSGFCLMFLLLWSVWFMYNFTTASMVLGSLVAIAYVARMARRTMKLLKAHISNKSIHKEE